MSKANKTLKDPDEVKKIKHVLEEAEATIQFKVCLKTGVIYLMWLLCS